MCNYQHTQFWAAQRIHAFRNDAQCIDIQTRVGLIHYRNFGPQGRHLQHLGALLFTARKTFIQIAPGKGMIHPQ